jgi:hypothetical protein
LNTDRPTPVLKRVGNCVQLGWCRHRRVSAFFCSVCVCVCVCVCVFTHWTVFPCCHYTSRWPLANLMPWALRACNLGYKLIPQ